MLAEENSIWRVFLFYKNFACNLETNKTDTSPRVDNVRSLNPMATE